MTSAPAKLSLIQTKAELAELIGVPLKLLEYRAFGCEQSLLYSASSHRKRSGGERIIHAPRWPLLNIQSKILRLLEELYRPSSRVMGFVKGRGIKANAKFHVGKKLILNIDLVDYFATVHIGRVRGRLRAQPYGLSNDIATTIAKLCTLNGVLPTGAPTSPILANMVSSPLDASLTSLARSHGCFYTRYADDITFSTNRKSFPPGLVKRSDPVETKVTAGDELRERILVSGFSIQDTKTKLLDKMSRQEVCGVTCNERLNVRRTFMREVRGAIHDWRSKGKDEAQTRFRQKYNWRESSSIERSIRGRIEHIIHIRGENDKVVANIVGQFNSLPGRLFSDIIYDYRSADPHSALTGVCLIECADEGELEWSQGTGFVIEGGSIVTNDHVISYNRKDGNGNDIIVPFGDILISFDGNEVKYDVEIVYRDAKRDIAVLKVKERFWDKLIASKACRLSFAQAKTGDAVITAGFPSHSDGSSVKVYQGHVTGTINAFGQAMFSISQPIVKGNSGGPVIDEIGQIIGIATRGVDDRDFGNIAHNGCIPLHSIQSVLADTIG